MRLRKSLLIAVLAAVFAAAAYSGYWFYARGVALSVVADWVARQRQAGFRIDHGPPQTGGYPFVVRIRFERVSVAPADGSWRWRGDALGIEIRPWNFRRVRLEAFGAQRLDLRRGGAVTRVDLAAREAVAVAAIGRSGRVAGATLRLKDLRLSGAAGEFRAAEFWLDAAMADPPPSTHTRTWLTLSLAAADAVLPARFDTRLGRKVETLRADLRVLGAISGAALGDAVEGWRQDGGTVEVDWLHVAWGGADLRAKGTLALDDGQRPLGALSADIRGYATVLDALRDASVVSDNAASLAKIGLALLARKPADGGAPVLTVPVTAQAGKLYFGPLKILDLSRLRF